MHHRSKRRAVCSSSARITTAFFLSFLAISAFAPSALAKQTDQEIAAPVLPVIPVPEPDSDPMMDGSDRADGQIFTLKHLFHHGLDEYPDLHRRLDIESGATVFVETEDGVRETAASFRARAQSLKIQRLTDRRPSTIEPILAAARNGAEMQSLSADFWTMDELPGPNVTDKETVLNLAIMSANSYVAEPGTGKWLDIGQHVNHSSSFGWEKDGLRGHIFADPTNSTIIMSIKGTSVAVFDGAETTTNDKENDNLLFGCCCGSGGPWAQKQACDCYLSTYTCNQTCLEGSLRQENRYYRAVLDLYSNVTELYPESEVWLTGHSLGGAVNALLALTYGLPVVTFEAPGDALAAARLGLPSPPGSDPDMPQTRKDTGAFHFGHTADPIFMGVCNGATSACSLGGYALETACHTGKECIYDVVTDKGWRVGLGTHSILQVINDVIKVYDDVPSCEPNEACYDCTNWKFPKSNSSDSSTSTSTSTSTTRTRTSTCKTPGWWGCLDETTTTTTDTSSSTSTSETTTTSSCKTPGWFGCNDPTTTVSSAVPAPTITTTSAPTSFVSSTESSSTCQHPGWFGRCKDPSPTSVPSKSSAVPSTSCHTPGLLWGCRDHSATTTKPPSLKPSTNLEL